MSEPTRAKSFFETGGTLRPGAPSYVERRADGELYERVLAGEFCYVLAPRQTGKSSLMARTAHRLRTEGVRVAVVDLTQVGQQVGNHDANSWYYGVAHRIHGSLKLGGSLRDWWNERLDLPAVQRLMEFFREIVLDEAGTPVVIFLDEIDSTIGLPFADDFFAAIRSCYNARATEPRFDALTFVLLGVATPNQLIQDPARTPFNIGRGVELTDFTLEEAGRFGAGLGPSLIERVLAWTGGHPYLTQAVAREVAARTEGKPVVGPSGALVDECVRDLFLSARAQRDEVNLKHARARLTEGDDQRARRLLRLYFEVCRDREVADDPTSSPHALLKLSGVVKVDDAGFLRVRNRIYAETFDEKWTRTAIPRSRTPLIVGLSAVVLVVSLAAAYSAWQSRREAEVERGLAEITGEEASLVIPTMSTFVDEHPSHAEQARSSLARRENGAVGVFEQLGDTTTLAQVATAADVVAPLMDFSDDEGVRLAAGVLWALDYTAARESRDTEDPEYRTARDAVIERLREHFGEPAVETVDWVEIPGDTFLMGSDADDVADDEQPVHAVTVSKFWMTPTEVTNAQFAPFASRLPRGWRSGEADHPAVSMGWYEAYVFAAWLGGRLPTEAEWEYAARGGLEGKRFPWGDQDVCEGGRARANFNDSPEENCDDGYPGLAPVCSYPPTGFELCDMAGNAWEWTADWYGDSYLGGEQEDPWGSSRGGERVLRGGGFWHGAWYLRAASRVDGYPGDRFVDFAGFRVVRPAPPSD